MTSKQCRNQTDRVEQLRQKAKALLRERPEIGNEISMDVLELIDELAIHHAELEVQNEKLRRTQGELSDLHREYVELYYDFAPCGYVTLDPGGFVKRINLAAASLLELDRAEAVRRPFWRFIDPESRDEYHKAKLRLEKTGKKRQVDLKLVPNKDGRSLWISADILADLDANGEIRRYRMTLSDITERKGNEEARRKSEEGFRALAEASSEVLYRMSPDWSEMRQLHSRGFLADTESSSREWLRKYIHPDDRPYVTSAVKEAIENKSVFELEHRVRIEDGSLGWTFSRAVPVLYANGEIVEWFGAASDITERKKSEKALRESEALYRAVARNFPDGAIYVFDHDLRFRLADGRAMENLGFRREELEGKTIREAIDEQTFSILEKRYPRVLAGESLHYETELKGRVFSSDYVPIRDESGNVTAGMVVSQDITERKRTEEALRQALAEAEESRRMLEALMAYAPVGITVAHADGTIRLVSDFGERMTKRSRESLYKESLGPHAKNWGIYLPDGRTPAGEEDLPLLRAVKHGEVTRNKELSFRHPDGTLVPILASAGPIFDSEGRIAGGINVWVDIAARKRSEEKLRLLNQTLERKVAERTAVAETRALQLQQLALELSNAEDRERKQIALVLHDDLQQYLAAVRFHLQALSPERPGERTREQVRQIEKLIDESIRRCRSLSHELSPPILHQSGFLAALEWLAEDTKAKHGFNVALQIRKEAEPESPALASMMFRSVRELLFNSVKHSGGDAAVVEAGVEGDTVFVRVEDKGKGCDPGLFSNDNAIRMAGFGLFSIRERITFVGGRCEIESAPGKGCRITLRIPKSGVSAPASTDRAAIRTAARRLREIEAPDEQGAQVQRNIKILVADDHAVLRQGLSNLLEKEPDLEVVGQAADGREAVRLASELSPDVVLMDVTMPHMDGIEATRRIGKANPNIRIIGLSMHDDPDTQERMTSAGATAYLYKASPVEKLLEAIRSSLL